MPDGSEVFTQKLMWSSQYTCKADTILIPILQIRKQARAYARPLKYLRGNLRIRTVVPNTPRGTSVFLQDF